MAHRAFAFARSGTIYSLSSSYPLYFTPTMLLSRAALTRNAQTQTTTRRTKEWEKYEPAAAKLVSIKTQRFANYVGLEKSERLLGRKVRARVGEVWCKWPRFPVVV